MSGSTSGGNYIGYGSDTITLKMAEDQAQGEDAAFTVNVDGQQIGGLQTARAAQSSGQTEEFTFNGDWAPGSHDVTVTFANNFIYPGQSGDRNLYVDGVTYNGQTISDSKTGIYQSPLFPPNSTNGNNFGNAVFRVNDTTSIPSGAGPTQTTSPGAVSVGSGADTLKLGMAEDAYQGDAQFTVSVDGKQIGGTLTTTALITHGQSQEFDIHGDFGSGGHSVSISFVNDRIGDFYPAGTPGLPPQGQWAVDTTDRNLYVTGVTLNGGAPASGTPWEFSSDGSKDFWVTAGSGSDSGSGTSDNASVSSSSLDAGSSSAGLSFIASSDTTDTSSGNAASGDTSSGNSALSDTSSGDTSSDTVAVPATSTTAQDFSVPSPSSTGSDTSTGTTGAASLTSQMPAHQHGWWMAHQG